MDLNKKNGKAITCRIYTYDSGSKIDVDSLTLEFDAHGVGRGSSTISAI